MNLLKATLTFQGASELTVYEEGKLFGNGDINVEDGGLLTINGKLIISDDYPLTVKADGELIHNCLSFLR